METLADDGDTPRMIVGFAPPAAIGPDTVKAIAAAAVSKVPRTQFWREIMVTPLMLASSCHEPARPTEEAARTDAGDRSDCGGRTRSSRDTQIREQAKSRRK